ncbi:MAG: 23S rRNA (uracil(1939)-C(5))-methyltransferase RlmD [Planctomycetes bacterium]|nr:23S rRNA (uracil(1939)-C(5))-methyltransferase RlmD [Planctomycetota bacterium]
MSPAPNRRSRQHSSGRSRPRAGRPSAAPRKAKAPPLPWCPHFGVCGGCSLLDQPIGQQLQAKLIDVETKIGGFLTHSSVAWDPPERTPLHFRTKLLYPVRKDDRGQATVGIFARRSHDVVPIRECRTQDPGLTEFGRRAETVLRELGLQPFDEQDGSGQIRAIWARLAAGTGELLLGVVTTPGLFPAGDELAERLLVAARALPALPGPVTKAVGVVRSISERDDLFLLGDRHVPLRGRDWCEDRRDGLTFQISAGSFYQVHREASSLLYRQAVRMCGDVRGQQVIDGYGGVGAFGLRLLRAGAARLTIVEDNTGACRDAEQNARKNGFADVTTVMRAPFATAELPERADLLVVDPPRSGLQAAGVARVLAAKPRHLLHVACDVDSLAADLEGLCHGGYRLVAARLCDLFPHTEHVEVIAALQRTD